MEVEDISWVSLTSGWATEKERHLTIGDGLLGQIIEDDESVLSVVTEPLTNTAAFKNVLVVLKHEQRK